VEAAGQPATIVETLELAGGPLEIARPPDAEALLVEEAFEREHLLPYWAEPWPSGVVLADELSRRSLGGVRVLELGCGLGLASIAAARTGAAVLATDWSPEALRFTVANATRNGVAVEIAHFNWRRPSGTVLRRAPWELVVAADVLYERRNVADLLRVLPFLVDSGGEVLVADPGRAFAEAFVDAAAGDWRHESRRSAREPTVRLHSLRRRQPAGRRAERRRPRPGPAALPDSGHE
jgi:predicted nicotinamide N-methyase